MGKGRRPRLSPLFHDKPIVNCAVSFRSEDVRRRRREKQQKSRPTSLCYGSRPRRDGGGGGGSGGGNHFAKKRKLESSTLCGGGGELHAFLFVCVFPVFSPFEKCISRTHPSENDIVMRANGILFWRLLKCCLLNRRKEEACLAPLR